MLTVWSDAPSFLLPPPIEIQAVRSEQQHPDRPARRGILLIAKSAFAAAPHREMQRLAAQLGELCPEDVVSFAFTEQGTPSFFEGLVALVARNLNHIIILPLILPMEPSFFRWLDKSIKRWRGSGEQPWPGVSITQDIASSPFMLPLVADLLREPKIVESAEGKAVALEGTIVPQQRYRVLVCSGATCNSAGADTIWNHLRNQQERQKLRIVGEGTMTAKSTCLGPCSLAPVLQVFPEGTYYGGVTEQAVDDIISCHLLGGRVVETYAYHPTGHKQRLKNPQIDPRR
ncbi:(2Fe-2S) ferredoxin domain-containing protein [Agrobacterium sp. SORGH_AS 787]|uniref:(2Fe-2S) ferredoxin domain-containing protein n=1 Tax=Agrobacterium sp. SORGH_AS 787 TaxID=3041775 RepID=UPI00278636DD|nr:(2Fe-2S) ferredoxin [Rhizobium sp. SORGH_AS_0787]